MATPPSAAHSAARLVSTPRSSPMAQHTSPSATAPKAQRQKTTCSAGRPDCTTNQPMVPEIAIAAPISSVPCVFLSMPCFLPVLPMAKL
jgi:hypothetical protein